MCVMPHCSAERIPLTEEIILKIFGRIYICIYIYISFCFDHIRNACKHIYVYVCIHIYTYTYIHIYISWQDTTYMHIHIYIKIYLYTYTHTFIHIHIHTCVYIYVYIYMPQTLLNASVVSFFRKRSCCTTYQHRHIHTSTKTPINKDC